MSASAPVRVAPPPPLVEELLPAPDPARCCALLEGLPYRLFLDSGGAAARLARYSFLTADPVAVVRSKGARVERVTLPAGGTVAEPVAEPFTSGDVLEALRETMGDEAGVPPIEGLPPFQGGAAGFLAYDWGEVLEPSVTPPRHDDLALPDAVLGVYDWVIAWDHEQRRAWIVSTGLPEREPDARARRAAGRLEQVRSILAGSPRAAPRAPRPAPRVPRAPSHPVEHPQVSPALGLRSSFTRDGYLAAVARVREYILAGDIFQANLSQRLEAPLREPAWDFYARLRAQNPAPFAAFLDFPEALVVSASPERFLSVDTGGAVETRPIKGTRPRGFGPEHDAALGRALEESEKDRAENLMIVDLLRNDLSRVCAPGTVRVPELFTLERHPTVHHLVSTVVGTLAPGNDALHLLRAAFPGGSITGAPKVRAMQIIAELEPSRRGVYCGAIGYWSVTGALDTSIVIRTSVVVGDTVYFSVGGGIVADSDPESEYRETLDKAAATIRALGG